jgi:RimJ/RimL family protein N-acetyltransferase
MREDVVVRPTASVFDALAMRKVRNTCRRFMTNDVETIGFVQQLAWWWLRMPEHTYPYIVETDDGKVGYAIIKKAGNRGWLTAGLLPEWRGQGYGTEVFRRLTVYTEHMDLIPSLEVRMTNEPAIAVYRKLGFTKTTGDGVTMRMVKR